MNNLTSTLLTTNSEYDIQEYIKQGDAFNFNNGEQQRIIAMSIPSLTVDITYMNITKAEFQSIKTAFEDNNSNTFICEFDSDIDMRGQLMTSSSATYAFNDFNFSEDAKSIGFYNGSITLISSVFFDFLPYQELFTQSSSYNRVVSTDESFITLLDEVAKPMFASYNYKNVNLTARIGSSISFKKDKGSLIGAKELQFILTEANFLSLLTYYRKKSGIMGEFGMREFVYDGSNYNSRFVEDSLQYNKHRDGFYRCSLQVEDIL